MSGSSAQSGSSSSLACPLTYAGRIAVVTTSITLGQLKVGQRVRWQGIDGNLRMLPWAGYPNGFQTVGPLGPHHETSSHQLSLASSDAM
jgi:hypothetical protein